MNKIIKSFTLLVLLVLLLAPAVPVYAQSGGPGKIVFGDNFTLKSGDELNGDLVVFGGNVTIEKNADLNGNLVVFGGTVSSNGSVNGDAVVFGGQISLAENAVVTGDVVTIGGQVSQAEGAVVKGQVVKNVSPSMQFPSGQIPADVKPPRINFNFNPFLELFKVFGIASLAALLGVFVVLFFESQLDKVAQVAINQPIMVGGIGILSVFIAIAMFFTILPLFALAFAWLFGVIAIGKEIGKRTGKALNQEWTPVIATGLGTFFLVFLLALVNSINNLVWFMVCFTWFIPVLVSFLAVGAVALTIFGTRPIQPVGVTVYTPPANTDQLPPAS